MVKASIIIPVYNQLDYTKQCMAFLKKYTDLKDVEIIVVDNSSTDGTGEYFRNCKSYIYLRNDENMGFPKAVNRGMRNAQGKYYVIPNNDVLVTEGWLDRLISVSEKEEHVGLAGPVTNWISGAQLDKGALYKDLVKMEEHAAQVWKKNDRPRPPRD